ncbi:class I SAM-dependent methyltransferase [Chitinophaga silvatica]|uniref:Class I SAM-dependent methyltransferase n=1 Tax=Chitinophaga silvatica TaxID=2282649 RepID=A0A3E1Y8T0_9BACT|nr:class I SAM-dependent methyltransferase [Chitinophaga silvatica]RFS21813.1 class I SAM-dependent methyltransferase [Chitinophaga silvatica]
MTQKAYERAKMPTGTNAVLDSRTLTNSYPTLVPFIQTGMHVLDIGCGTGAISAGIAEKVGENGTVTGIDNSAHLIAKGKEDFADIPNLTLLETDLFTFQPAKQFDLLVSARVLQWLNNPAVALKHFLKWLKPGGSISILDYNHEEMEWEPDVPESMQLFYSAFLEWRKDAGMDNAIADHLPEIFHEIGLSNVEVFPSNEVYERSSANFTDKAGIWSKVAALRGPQVVEAGFITEALRLQAIAEYDKWLIEKGQRVVLHLKEVRGQFN